jgi:hypothetical protein
VAGVPNPISKSLRFNSADSAYLNRTPASAGNRKTWTWSGWVKQTLGNASWIFLFGNANSGNTQGFYCEITANNNLNIYDYNSAYVWQLQTTQVFRDPAAWYHIVVAIDTTQATSTNRVKVYVNGSQITAFGTATYPTLNYDSYWNNNIASSIGRSGAYNGNYFNGYQTEINFIDGQALTPSSFGMTDPVTGVWEPLKYSGTYGTNGFYLNFKDATSTTTLGYDYSGNSNTWTTNNFSVTAGAGNDSLTDVPTPWIVYNTTGDVGGVVRGNYCTLNPLKTGTTYKPTLSDGNLKYEAENNTQNPAAGTLGVASGKWYFEATVTNIGYIPGVGVTDPSINFGTGDNWRGNNLGVVLYSNGTLFTNGSSTSSGYTYTTNDVLGVAFDADTGKVWIAKNNTWFNSGNPSAGTGQVATGSGYASLTPVFDGTEVSTKDTIILNCGQRPFAYTPPSGFLSLCTTNLPASTILKGSDYFNILLYTGNGSAGNAKTGLGFQPDFLWFKSRNQARSHALFDAVRTRTYGLASESTNGDYTSAAGRDLASFDSDGFTVGVPENFNSTNANGDTIVTWAWKANGAGVSNTAGSITSTVSANTTSGFSIVTYTGTGANATVGHGLGVAPHMIITKRRTTFTSGWGVWHTAIAGTEYLLLNSTAAKATATTAWNSTIPTSTVFSIGDASFSNGSVDGYVAYCFAPISGFSAFGSYTGNGSADGPFVYLGFRPRFIMIKDITAAYNWIMVDTARDTYNGVQYILIPNLSDAEYSGTIIIDILSNGFKYRFAGGSGNTSGDTLVYAAFAENPFKNALAR